MFWCQEKKSNFIHIFSTGFKQVPNNPASLSNMLKFLKLAI